MRSRLIKWSFGILVGAALAGACDQGAAAPPIPGAFPTAPGAPPTQSPTGWTHTSAALSGAWDGRSTFICDGRMNTTLTGMTVVLTTGTAIRASGDCIMRLVGMNITAPVVLEVADDAVVTLQGGQFTGVTKAIVATGTGSVFSSGAVVVGALERSPAATIHGVADQPPAIAEVPGGPAAPPAQEPPPAAPAEPAGHVDLLHAALCCNLGKLPACRGSLKVRGTACAIADERPACASCAAGWAQDPGPADPGLSLTRACPMCR